jgi:hypothetical protein
MDAHDVVEWNRKHVVRVAISKVRLCSKRKSRQFLNGNEIVRMNSGGLNGSAMVGNVIIGSANHVFQPLQLKIRDLVPTGGLDCRFRP